MAISKLIFNGVTQMDVTGTTAVAADVASGKYFTKVDGTLGTGTASGGGGTIVMGAIRSDAELVQKWTYDRLIVSDEGKTIGTYNTSQSILLSTADLSPTIELDSDYDYRCCLRGIAKPIYSTNTIDAGRFEYFSAGYITDYFFMPANTVDIGGTKYNTDTRIAFGFSAVAVCPYWSSSSSLSIATSNSYGANIECAAQSSISNNILTVKQPALRLRGHATYLNQTFYNLMTDIRYQYVIELWKVARSNQGINGWGFESLLSHAVDCAQSASGDLT